MPSFRIALLALLLVVPRFAAAGDLPARYTTEEKPLKTAIAGTMLTFTLYSDPSCTTSVYSTAIAIENVDLIGRIKPFNPKNAVKKKNTTELRATLTAVPATPSLYLKVTGTGVTPIGGACQVQASGLGSSGASALVVKDSLGATIGKFDGQSSAIYDDGGALIRLTTYTTGFNQSFFHQTLFASSNCTGSALAPADSSLVRFADVVGTTAYYAPTTGVMTGINSALGRSALTPFTNQAACDGFYGVGNSTFVPPDTCCQTYGSPITISAGPESTVDVSAFVPPFSAQ